MTRGVPKGTADLLQMTWGVPKGTTDLLQTNWQHLHGLQVIISHSVLSLQTNSFDALIPVTLQPLVFLIQVIGN